MKRSVKETTKAWNERLKKNSFSSRDINQALEKAGALGIIQFTLSNVLRAKQNFQCQYQKQTVCRLTFF